MVLIHYWRVIRRRAWLIILFPLVSALAVGLISLELPKVHEAQVSLLVRPAEVLSPVPGSATLTADQILRTYARLMTERPILEGVISDERLRTDAVSFPVRLQSLPNRIRRSSTSPFVTPTPIGLDVRQTHS